MSERENKLTVQQIREMRDTAAKAPQEHYEYVPLANHPCDAHEAPVLTDENGICSFGCKHLTIRVIKPQDCISQQAQLELVRLRVIAHIQNGATREAEALNKARWKEIEARTRMDFISLHG